MQRLHPAGPVPEEAELPAGTVTFLLTDIEGSTRLWESVPEAMEVALERHDRLVTEVIGGHGGVVVTSRGESDSFFAVFARSLRTDAHSPAHRRRLSSSADRLVHGDHDYPGALTLAECRLGVRLCDRFCVRDPGRSR